MVAGRARSPSLPELSIRALAEPDRARLARWLAALSAPVESYVEDHLLGSAHHALYLDERRCGTAAVHGADLLVHLDLDAGARLDGRRIFQQVVRELGVRQVMVPSCDELLLTLALDRHASLRLQATLFWDAGPEHGAAPDAPTLSFSLLRVDELPAIQAMIGDFLESEDMARMQAQGSLHVGRQAGEPATLGIIEPPQLLAEHASIGMFTRADLRLRGLATETLMHLKQECYRQGWRPVAGCPHGNRGSWRSLERAGMIGGTRLLRIELASDDDRDEAAAS